MSLRIIDANLNRAREGLRTCEEYARLELNDAGAADAVKQVRRLVQHCVDALAPLSGRMLAMRDIEGDVGVRPEADDVTRTSPHDIAIAGIKRTQEALRVVEEFCQLHSLNAASAAAKARYEAYNAEKRLFGENALRPTLDEHPVMVVFSGMSTRDDWRDVLTSLLKAGARLFQLREKNLTSGQLQRYAEAVMHITNQHRALVVINDSVEVAASAGAAGVHLGQDDLSPAKAREILGSEALIGVSTHNWAEAKDAEQMGADYVGLGAMFHTETKKVQSLGGPTLVSQVLPELDIPVYCIGGINRDNVAELIGHRARHIAVSSALLNAPDPGAEYKLLFDALGD